MENKSNLSNEALLELLTLTSTVCELGTTEWRNKDGLLHRKYGPAVIYEDGSVEYWVDGYLYRAGAPAIEYTDGYKAYWEGTMLHREDGPAVIYPDGTTEYWINGHQIFPVKDQ